VVEAVRSEDQSQRDGRYDDLAQGSNERSGSRLMGLTGVGCAALIAGSVLFCVLVAILIHFLG